MKFQLLIKNKMLTILFLSFLSHVVFIMLITVRMPTSVGILRFNSTITLPGCRMTDPNDRRLEEICCELRHEEPPRIRWKYINK